MAPVPKKKHTRSRSDKRRNAPANKGVVVGLFKCPKCSKLKLPHIACSYCGFYR